MPSDLPSQTPSGAAAPTGTGTPPAAGTGIGNAATPGTPTDVRRYSAQSQAKLAGSDKQPGISNSFALAMIVAFAVVAAVMIRQGPGLLQPPPRVLPPVAGAAAPATAASTTGTTTATAPPPVSANSPLVRAYGSGTVNQASRQAQRAGQAAAIAALCGLRSRAWVNDAREALAKQLAADYPTFDPEVNAQHAMQQHIIAHYLAGQQTAQQALNERGKETMCTDLPYSPDYRMTVRAGEQANIRSR